MTSLFIVPSFVTFIITFILLIFAGASIAFRHLYKFKVQSEKSKTERILYLVFCCLLILVLIANMVNYFWFDDRKGDVPRKDLLDYIDMRVRGSQDTVSRIPKMDLSRFSSNTFELTKNYIAETEIEYLKMLKSKGTNLKQFEMWFEEMDADFADWSSCRGKIDFGSEIFKIRPRVVRISEMVRRQISILKDETKSALVAEEKRTATHLQNIQNLTQFLGIHMTNLAKTVDHQKGSTPSPMNQIIAICLVVTPSILSLIVCFIILFAIFRQLVPLGPKRLPFVINIVFYANSGQIILFCLVIFGLFISGYLNNPCQPEIEKNHFMMKSFDESNDLNSNDLFNNCLWFNHTLFSVSDQKIVISPDPIIRSIQKKIGSFEKNLAISTEFVNLLDEWKKNAELYQKIESLTHDTCFFGANLQNLQIYGGYIKEIVDMETRFNESLRNLPKSLSDSIFGELRGLVEIDGGFVNTKIQHFDFSCQYFSELHRIVVQLQCPRTYSYIDESMIHIILSLLVSAILVGILLRVRIWYLRKEQEVKPEEGSSQSSEEATKSEVTPKPPAPPVPSPKPEIVVKKEEKKKKDDTEKSVETTQLSTIETKSTQNGTKSEKSSKSGSSKSRAKSDISVKKHKKKDSTEKSEKSTQLSTLENRTKSEKSEKSETTKSGKKSEKSGSKKN